jgi:hypothetical protein
MSLQSWQETLVSAQGDGPQILNSTTAATILPPAAKITLPNNWFNVGKVIRLTVAGHISCVATTPGTLILDLRLAAVIAFTSQAIPMNVTAKTTLPFYMQVLLTCRSIGAGTTATLMPIGFIITETIVGVAAPAAGPAGALCVPNTVPVAGTGFDSTAALTVDVFAKFSVTTATTQITLSQYILEALN